MKTKTFTELEVWKKAHKNVLEIYRTTENFPKSEIYGLTSQFRRAAISIAANIAEGYKKKGKADKLRFFNFSQGSLEECRYYVLLSRDLSYVNEQTYKLLDAEIEFCCKLLNSYYRVISNDNS